MYEKPNAVSLKPWYPIWDVRTRSEWVQATILDLLKQLRALRNVIFASLPSIDILGLSPLRQLRVDFGDLISLCDAIEYIHCYNPDLGVAYGGPDEKGTLWIKFYQIWNEERPWEKPLQFIIWIDSESPSIIALEGSSHLAYEDVDSESETREEGPEADTVFSEAWCHTQATWVERYFPTSRRLAPMLPGSVQS